MLEGGLGHISVLTLSLFPFELLEIVRFVSDVIARFDLGFVTVFDPNLPCLCSTDTLLRFDFESPPGDFLRAVVWTVDLDIDDDVTGVLLDFVVFIIDFDVDDVDSVDVIDVRDLVDDVEECCDETEGFDFLTDDVDLTG